MVSVPGEKSFVARIRRWPLYEAETIGVLRRDLLMMPLYWRVKLRGKKNGVAAPICSGVNIATDLYNDPKYHNAIF